MTWSLGDIIHMLSWPAYARAVRCCCWDIGPCIRPDKLRQWISKHGRERKLDNVLYTACAVGCAQRREIVRCELPILVFTRVANSTKFSRQSP